MSKKYTFTMVVVKPTGKGGKPLKPKEIKPKKKMGGGMMKKYSKGGEMLKGGQKKLDKNKDGKISGEDFKLIRREKPEMKPIKRSMGSTSTEGNIKHGKLKSQKELKKITDSDEYKKSDYQTKNKMLNVATQSKGGEMKKGYGAARQSGMGLQDENLVPGKSMDYYKDLM